MHTAQSNYELEFIREQYGKTPVELLEDLGVLDSRWLLTHSLYIGGNHPETEERDLELLAENGVSVANCPWIYSFRGGYLNSFSRYRRAGINMCLGTDTFPQDILRELRWGAMMAKVAEQSPEAGTAAELYNAVTLNPAAYLGRRDLGRLAPGAKADLVFVDFDRFSIGPTEDPIRSLVYFATAADVKKVVVDGEVIVENYRSTRVDEAAVVCSSSPVSDKVRDTLAHWSDPDAEPCQVFAPSFPRY
jgi:cytosine/adenosine deaminase-related metal-dependent hydrolase